MKKIKATNGIELDFTFAGPLDEAAFLEASAAKEQLESGTGPGSDFLGWMDLPNSITDQLVDEVIKRADQIRNTDALVVVGIGGSYLGARAVIDALSKPFEKQFEILFAGHQLDADYHKGLLTYLRDKDYSVNVISKSGTTTEPAIAFRLLMNDLNQRRSKEELSQRVIVTTDRVRGALRPMAEEFGLGSFVVPDDVGGRYSVLTPVGLLPIAAAGFDIKKLLSGAKQMMKLVRGQEAKTNPAMAYAVYRNQLYRKGKKIEVMASYTDRLKFFAEWWKQLFGESEGKDKKGIFPASVNLTSDLHSMGQLLQDGERSVFETILDVKNADKIKIPSKETDNTKKASDGLDHLAGRELNDINRTVIQAAMEAHHVGNVPCLRVEVPEIKEETVGALLYMFEYGCAISAYMLKVNPFDQPGVEEYKKNMKKLLG